MKAKYVIALAAFLIGLSLTLSAGAQLYFPPTLAPTLVGATATPTHQFLAITTASAVSPTVPAGTRMIEVQAQGCNMRWRNDGTSPTTTVGMFVYAGDTRVFEAEGSSVELIAEAGSGTAACYFIPR